MKEKTFDEIVKLAGDFVTRQEGKWDHAEWLGFLSTLQKKGFELSEERQGYIGQVLEATKRFYQATASTQGIEKALNSVSKHSVDFVMTHQGVWSHGDWETFTRDIQQNTLSLTEETTAYLGSILESVRAFYTVSAITAPLAEKPAVAVVERKQPRAGATQPKAATKQPRAGATQPRAATKQLRAGATPPKTGTKRLKEGAKAAKGPVTQADDDLTAIGGIGPALQRKLKEHGIRSFTQIAALSDQDIERLEGSIIKFSGRIKRDDWVGQARRFSEGMR